MVAFAGSFLSFALVVVGCILAAALVVFWWTNRARNLARLEMKRHVQKEEVRGGA
jgi:hypothetical protein